MLYGNTKDNENPPIPPLEKGGKGGFERVFSGNIHEDSIRCYGWRQVAVCRG